MQNQAVAQHLKSVINLNQRTFQALSNDSFLELASAPIRYERVTKPHGQVPLSLLAFNEQVTPPPVFEWVPPSAGFLFEGPNTVLRPESLPNPQSLAYLKDFTLYC